MHVACKRLDPAKKKKKNILHAYLRPSVHGRVKMSAISLTLDLHTSHTLTLNLLTGMFPEAHCTPAGTSIQLKQFITITQVPEKRLAVFFVFFK